jgi:hypothetical protein
MYDDEMTVAQYLKLMGTNMSEMADVQEMIERDERLEKEIMECKALQRYLKGDS